jgi:hypothetical protein
MAGFKSSVTRRINKSQGDAKQPVWQRNYYEHVIRNEDELERIQEYIINNPLRWHLDKENLQRMARMILTSGWQGICLQVKTEDDKQATVARIMGNMYSW